MGSATGAALGGATLVMTLAFALGQGARAGERRDVPPATADVLQARAASVADARAAARGSAQALEEVLAAAEGMQAIACELAAGGVQGFWPGHRGAAFLTGDTAAADRLEEGLRAARTPEGAEVLVRSLVSGEGCRARLALGLLDRAEPASAASLLRPFLADVDAELRRRGALGMGAVESDADLAALEGLLGDEFPAVRVAAAWALGEIENPDAIPSLSRALAEDRSAEVRRAAARALGEIAG